MNNIRVKNIRSLIDTGTVELSPLTMLLGRNSSGKSTFLRLFPLFKQSWNSKNRGALALYGDFVDFGDFESMKTKHKNCDSIGIEFEINIFDDERNLYFPLAKKAIPEIPCLCSLEIKRNSIGLLYCSYVEIRIKNHKLVAKFSQEGEILLLKIDEIDCTSKTNGINVTYAGRSVCLPSFYGKDTKQEQRYHALDWEVFLQPFNNILDEFCKKNKIVDKREDDLFFTIMQLARFMGYEDKKSYLSHLAKNKKRNSLENNLSKILRSKEFSDEAYENLLLAITPFVWENIRSHLFAVSQNIFYSKPLRAQAERYYRSQSLAVDDIAPDGSNLVSYIKNMSVYERTDFENWTLANFDFAIKIKDHEGHQSVHIKEKDNSEEYNVTDMGFGFSQMIPIVAQLWDIVVKNSDSKSKYNSFIYAIEQPELHLHPALQAKTLKLFAKVIEVAKKNKADLKIIVETHSETMINYLGKLISNKKIDHKDVKILVFDKLTPGSPTAIKSSFYDENGVLENWPFGFFNAE